MSETMMGGRLSIDPSVFLAAGSVIAGDVRIGANSSVWFNTVLRGDSAPIEIGSQTNLQDLTMVHVDEGCPARVGDRVTVGHRAIVHGCVIEDDCLVGMGAIVLSGARIGTGSLIGAGTLVREGQVVPPGSLVVGMPGKVVGPVGDEHRRAIARGAEHYAHLARSYRAGGFGRRLPEFEEGGARGSLDAWACDELDRERLLAALREGPAWARERFVSAGTARWTLAPAAGAWSAHRVVCHLCDAEGGMILPRVARMRTDELPVLEVIDAARLGRTDAETTTPEDALDAWQATRAELLAMLGMPEDEIWQRAGVHPQRGTITVEGMVRVALSHELRHRRQIDRALGGG